MKLGQGVGGYRELDLPLSTATFSSSPESHRNPDDRSIDDVSTGNERTTYKLKSYFDLAKEEIAEAVPAEEWGLAGDV
ncbi:unnamed protein product [Cuscuta campestris]|uniref:Uncharacterized protein n=1 Tax=Cuscuta campestris TaxID=132261 RepID=A0A484KJ48_9ASTE|nr:unnamed protein product [Cuscuta campestris]